MDEITPREAFLQSVERCAASPDFIPTFYERFMASSPEVQTKFIATNFERQHRVLVESLRLVAGATAGDDDALRELDARSLSHDRRHLDIAPSLYVLWLEALVETAAQFDPKWSPELEKVWNRMLGFAIAYMGRRY